LSSLRILTSASAPLPPDIAADLRKRLPAAQLYVMYGQTECTRISYLPPDQFDLRPGSVGKGMPGQQCWLVDENGQRLPAGSTGELVLQGDHVMRGYWSDPEATARKLRPCADASTLVMHTGDLFRSDAEGWLYFVARMDDIIKTRGEKVSPLEVEQVINRIPGVLESKVVCIPDEILGQAVKAHVVLREGVDLSEREVLRHCLAALESHMVPKTVAFPATLPRTDTGKIRNPELP
jgi:acyl-coenzyme A synthetase/AMP-(fatty) acid ligase